MALIDELNKRLTTLEEDVKVLRKSETERVGTILPYGGATEPGNGWLFCDGRPLNREEYPELYKVISANFGAPDNNHFNLPDLRGRFVRGVDLDDEETNKWRDPDHDKRIACSENGNIGNKVGSVQEDQFGKHKHQWMGWRY